MVGKIYEETGKKEVPWPNLPQDFEEWETKKKGKKGVSDCVGRRWVSDYVCCVSNSVIYKANFSYSSKIGEDDRELVRYELIVMKEYL